MAGVRAAIEEHQDAFNAHAQGTHQALSAMLTALGAPPPITTKTKAESEAGVDISPNPTHLVAMLHAHKSNLATFALPLFLLHLHKVIGYGLLRRFLFYTSFFRGWSTLSRIKSFAELPFCFSRLFQRRSSILGRVDPALFSSCPNHPHEPVLVRITLTPDRRLRLRMFHNCHRLQRSQVRCPRRPRPLPG